MSSDRQRTENFREHLGNVTQSGKRIWLYPKNPWQQKKTISLIVVFIVFIWCEAFI